MIGYYYVLSVRVTRAVKKSVRLFPVILQVIKGELYLKSSPKPEAAAPGQFLHCPDVSPLEEMNLQKTNLVIIYERK